MDDVAKAVDLDPPAIPPPKKKGRHVLGPGPGRPKGLPNRITASIKAAIEKACAPGACHAEGLYGWLVERANGGVEDRKIFAGMVARVLPAELQASVQHNGVVVQLGWLAGRNIGSGGTPTAQPAAIESQAFDITPQIGRNLRVEDPKQPIDGVIEGDFAAQADPPPPFDRQAGGPSEEGFPSPSSPGTK